MTGEDDNGDEDNGSGDEQTIDVYKAIGSSEYKKYVNACSEL
jgi:hypothetical protein